MNKKVNKEFELSGFRIGQEVVHKEFGLGKIIGYSEDVKDALIVQFPPCHNKEEAFKHRGNAGWIKIKNLKINKG